MVHRLFAVVLLVCAALVATPSAAQNINGDWTPTAGTMAGQNVPSNWLSSMKLSFNQASFSAISGNLTSNGQIEGGGGFGSLKPIVFSITEGADKGSKIYAIYKVESGSLTITYSRDGKQPNDFESTASNKYLKIVYTSGDGATSTVAGAAKASTGQTTVGTGVNAKGSGGSAAFE